ncbi:hypothetical protein KIH74_22925 [Kineosporia sp. J2-2]|uniref:Phage protein Gp19/Gp15/Gp42 n=1 Tax=Kineosporia corallincola TaxID=2835133 RepID=A0ABS5TL24_9ACTN|nr:hypothetical protein [Kineosporia corallincola]MBT0771813.1 hypothetical protein [Kineosporia corallincola]
MAYATVADLEAKWGKELSVVQAAMAEVLLEEGSAILDASVPGLAAAAGVSVPMILIRKVLTDAALRVLRNPAGVTTQTVGPESATFSGQSQRAELQFLPAELALITPADGGLSVGGYVIGSFRLGRPDWCHGGGAFTPERRWC